MNNSDFLQGLRAQDPEAVRHLTERYLTSVWRYVYVRVNGDRHLAEDIVSETVLALVRAANTMVDIDNPTAWMRSVANHKVQDHFRAAARVQHLINGAKHTLPTADDDDPVKQSERSENRAEIRQAMDALPEQHRLVLEWKYLDKLSVRVIAARLEITEKAAESVLFRARRDFRSRLRQVGVEQASRCSSSQSECRRPPQTDDAGPAAAEPAEGGVSAVSVPVKPTERSR